MSYQDYLESRGWKLLRLAAIIRDRYKCRCCNRQNYLQVHHLRYPANLGDDSVDNLVTMCAKHHMARHGIDPHAVHISIPIQAVMNKLFGRTAI